MAYYIHLEDNKIFSSGECPMGEPFQSIEVSEELHNDFVADPDKYTWNGTEVVENPDYEEIKRQKEQARIMEIVDVKLEIVDEPKDPNFDFTTFIKDNIPEVTGNKIVRMQFKILK